MNPAPFETIDAGYQRPGDPGEIWLARLWHHVLGFPVGIRENFFGVGGNSLDAAVLIDGIRRELGVQLPLNAVTDHPTVERLAALLGDPAERLSGPLVPIGDGDGLRPPLFLVHPDDGQVGPYCGLAHALGEDFAVFGLQAGGLYSGAEPLRTVPELAEAYLNAVRAACPAGPCLLGGCGVGAAVAYEMAGRLDDVRLVAVIDGALLDLPDAGATSEPDVQPGTVREADLPRILTDWQERGLASRNATPEFVARSLRVRRANRDALRDWRPSPITAPVDVLGAPVLPALPMGAVRRTHACGTQDELVGALRELIG